MSIHKEFEKWISKNFNGLSAYTLGQLLRMEYGFLNEHDTQEMIYVDLYHVFTKSATDKEMDTYNACMDIVHECAWL